MSFLNRFRRQKPIEAEPAATPVIVTDAGQITTEQFDWLAEELTLPGPVLRSYLELLGTRQTPSA